jgi:hypothetical protein
MLSPVSSHHHSAAHGGNTTPSQLRSAVAGIWSSVQYGVTGGSNSLPNHGIPVASTYEKLLEKHHPTLLQLKLSDPDLAETIARGFHRLQMKLRDAQAQTNASVQTIGLPYLYHELHAELRYENAQAKVLQIQAKQHETNVTSPEERKLRIARELAEARIKARQALQRNSNNSNNAQTTNTNGAADHDNNDDFDAASLVSSSASVASDDDDDHHKASPPQPPAACTSPARGSSNSQHSPTSVVIDNMDDHQAGTSSYVHLTPQQKHALLSVHDLDDEDDIREVATADDDENDDE